MTICKGRFWTENFSDILCSYKILPVQGMSLEEKFNALTRLLFFFWGVYAMIDFKNSLFVLAISLVIIILLYYLQKRKMNDSTEKFCVSSPQKDLSINNIPLKKVSTRLTPYIPREEKLQVQKPEQYRFCNDKVELQYDKRFRSSNQRLIGDPTSNIKGYLL